MNDDLDRILSSECAIAPSDTFLTSVMKAVLACRRYPEPIPFPWRRFAVGLVGGLACTFISALILAPGLSSFMPIGVRAISSIPSWLAGPELLWAVVTLAASWLTVRTCVVASCD